MSNCKICQYESKNGHALDCPKRVKRSYKETLELVERVAKRESGSTECGDSCHANDNPVHCQSCKPASPEWEEELHFGIMENYILDAEMMIDRKDGKKEEVMRGHYEKLKSFIRNLLSSERQSLYELIKEKTKELRSKRLHWSDYTHGYTDAISDVEKALSEIFEDSSLNS